MKTQGNRARYVAALAAVGLLAACGSDNSSSSSTTKAAAATSAAGSAATTAGGAVTSTGGGASTAAGATSGITFSPSNTHKANVDRTGQTIKIGLSNDEGGSFSLPEYRVGAEVGAKYVNDHGGINGAKIQLDTCLSDASPEGAVNCANKFVSDKVDIASYGIEVSIDAALDTYSGAKIPLITPAAYGTKQRTDPNATSFGSAAGAYAVWPLTAFKNLGATKVAFIVENTPSAVNCIDLLHKWAPQVGVDIVSETLVDPANPDYSAAVQTGISKGATAMWGFLSEPGCTAYVTAVDQLQYNGVKMAGACSQYMSVLGDKAVGTLNLIDTYFPDMIASAPPNIQANLKTYEDAMKAAGQDQYINGFATLSFSFMQDLKTLLETIPAGPINADSIAKAKNTDQWLPAFNGPDYNCGAKVWPAEPAYCRAGLMILKVVKQNGQLFRVPLGTDNYGYYYDPAIAAKSTSI
jgi:branched-chain amino acid transport system substrate-binding protein